VKDELAGKKGPCPVCKKIITIPALSSGAPQVPPSPARTSPKSPATGTPSNAGESPPRRPAGSADDLERAAAELFADQSAAAPAPVPVGRPIEFTCPHCDMKVSVAADLDGKQTPCPNPECRRIIRVPKQEKKQPLDWRKAPTGPSLARRDQPQAPEGAWGSEGMSQVSSVALSEAGVIPQEVERTPLTTWIKRVSVLVVVLVVVFGIAWWRLTRVAVEEQKKLVDGALALVDADKPKIGAVEDAMVFYSAGEWTLRTNNKKGVAKEARDHFRSARHLLASAPPTLDRDCRLIDLALLQVDLGGDQAEVDKKQRLTWDEVQHELAATLEALGRLPERHPAAYGPRAEALRLVCRKLLERKQVQVAYSLAAGGGGNGDIEISDGEHSNQAARSELREAQAVAGLEFARAGYKPQATQLEELALADYTTRVDDKNKLQAPDVPNIWALGLVLGNKDVQKLAADKAPAVRAAAKTIATAHGAKLEDEEAPKESKENTVVPELKLAALLATAESGDVGPALELVESEWPKDALIPRWQIIRLARAAPAKDWQQVNALADKFNLDLELQNEIRLVALAGRLHDSKPELTWIDGFPEKTSAKALARLMVVRAAAAKGTNFKSDIESWQPTERPFGYMGLALGLQDKK
jgi:hypothetical protein